jgi:hypothetical protein
LFLEEENAKNKVGGRNKSGVNGKGGGGKPGMKKK